MKAKGLIRSRQRNSRQSCGFPKPMKVLLSIRPEYVTAILNGKKSYEFRRVIFTKPVDTVLIYATRPIGKVVGEFRVENIITDDVCNLWSNMKEQSGMDENTFFSYFQGRSKGHAIKIGAIRKYRLPYCPKEKHGIAPPQCFAYL